MLERINGPVVGPIALSVTTTSVEVRVGASALIDRKVVVVQPLGGDIFWGFDSGVTTSTGIKLFKNTIYHLPYTDDITVYLISTSGAGFDTRISELA